MITISDMAAEKLREQMVNKCLEAGIGFRMEINTAKSGRLTFRIKLDSQRPGDNVVESDGIKMFLDPASASQIRGYQLDYQGEPEEGFSLLTTTQEVKSEGK